MNKHRYLALSAQPFVLPGLHERCPRNSPLAAARIVALALLANGEVNPPEQAAVVEHRVAEQLDMSTADWRDLVGAMRVQMSGQAVEPTSGPMDAETMASWLDEVDDPALRSRVMRLCRILIGADGFVDTGESALLRTAISRWQMPPDQQAEVEPMVYGLDFQVTAR